MRCPTDCECVLSLMNRLVVLPYINFSTLPELQELRLSLVNLADQTEGFGEVAKLLTDNLPPKLRKLTFILPFVRSNYHGIHVHRHGEYVPEDCRHLEDILSGAQLEGVTFILSNIPIGRARSWKQMLEQFFPVLHSRSLIKVECTTGTSSSLNFKSPSCETRIFSFT